MFQISNFFATCYNAVSFQKILLFVYSLFLSHIFPQTLSLSLSLSHLEFLLSTYHFFSLAEAADFVEAVDLAIEIDLA